MGAGPGSIQEMVPRNVKSGAIRIFNHGRRDALGKIHVTGVPHALVSDV